jgi:hypothetical protein
LAVVKPPTTSFGLNNIKTGPYVMKNISRVVFVLVVLSLAGGTTFLVTWDIPAPVKKVERVFPDDRFPR